MEHGNHLQYNFILIMQLYHNPVLTIIVPMYNVEKYIEACLKSLIHQRDIAAEIICINDGSTDSTYSIVNKFKKQNPTITLISIQNSGLSIARNTGLEYAKGKYICFVDADDMLKPNSLSTLMEYALARDLEAVYFNSQTIYESDDLKTIRKDIKEAGERENTYVGVMTGSELGLKFFENQEYTPSACMAIYKKAFLDHFKIQFIPGIIHEDNFFTYEVLLNSTRSSHFPEDIYIRLIRLGSIMTSLNLARSFIGYAITQYEILKYFSKIKDINQIKFTELLANEYSIHCSNLMLKDDVPEECFSLASKISNLGHSIYIKHILNAKKNLMLQYRKGLNDATIALLGVDGTEKRVTAPCVSYIDHVGIDSISLGNNKEITRITLVGWMLLWGKAAPSSIKIFLDSKHSESPITYEQISRPDVLKYHAKGQLMCGFKATFEIGKPFIQISVKGYWKDNVISEPIELKLH